MSTENGCDFVTENQNDCDNEKTHWRINAVNAVGNLIGRPSKKMLNLAKPGSRIEKIEAQRWVAHKQLFDKLVDYIMEGAQEANYDPSIMNISTHIESWRNIFAKRLYGNITPKTAMMGSGKIAGLNKLFDRIIKKRNKTIKKAEKAGGLSKADLFYAPPDYMASWIDKFGFVDKLIQKIMNLQDNNITMSGKFLNPITESRKKLKRDLNNILKDPKSNFGLNKQSTMDGVPYFEDESGRKVMLVEGKERNGEKGYLAYEEGDLEKTLFFIKTKDLMNANQEAIDKELVNLYLNTLVDELGNGQVRKIVPKLNQNIDKDDLKKINIKIKQLTNAKEGDRVPGIHTVVKGKWEYRYVMIKQGELENNKNKDMSESYNAYLIGKSEIGLGGKKTGNTINFIGKTNVIEGETISKKQIPYNQKELDDVLKEGYYKSDDYNDFGKLRMINKKTNKEEPQFKEFGHTKRFINFERMENQPNEAVMPFIFNNLNDIRASYKTGFKNIEEQNRKQEERRNRLKDNVVSYRTKAYQETEEEALQWLNNFYEANNINNNIYTEADGTIRTSTSFAAKKKENYFPHRYTKTTMYGEMLPSEIEEINEKIDERGGEKERKRLIEKGKYEGSDLERYYQGRNHLQSILDSFNDQQPFNMTPQQAKIVKNLKHITAWTNPLLRRKDGNLHSSYFNESYDALNRQKIMNELTEVAFKIDKVKIMPKGTLDFVVNRVKIAFGDPSSRAISIGLTGFKETSYDEFAKKLNSLPNVITGGNRYNGKDAEKIVKWITALPSSLFLGGSSAMQNSGQIINTMIEVGLRNVAKAYIETRDNKDYWDKIVQNTGTLNVLHMFADVMMADGNAKQEDAGFVDVGIAQIPMPNVFKLGKLLMAGRESFINNPNKDIDTVLLKMMRSQSGESRESIQSLLTVGQLMRGEKGKRISNEALRKKRGQFYDVMTAKKGTKEATLQTLFKELLGDESDALIKRMVSWKLSWWFDEYSAPGKDFFTFTGSEERLRKMTVVASLLHAQDQGLLSKEDSGDGNVFMSKQAIKIARRSVYQTQFGMTPPYLGEGFNGFGRALWQYKQYPSLQMQHDYQIVEKFLETNDGTKGDLNRIMSAVFKQMKYWFDKKNPYDPKDRNVDHEAIAMARFLSTRAIASTIASTMGMIPFIGKILQFKGFNTYGMLRGMENPALALMTRTLLWTVLFGMGANEEEEKRNEVTNALGFLFFPIALGMLFNLSKSMYETYDEHLN